MRKLQTKVFSYLRALEVVAEPLAGQADGRGVDDGHQLSDVLRQQLVEEPLVSLLQLHQVGVLVERLSIAAHCGTIKFRRTANENSST